MRLSKLSGLPADESVYIPTEADIFDEFLAQDGWRIANFFYERRSRWRTTVASWMKKRAVVLYWQEATQRRLCAPGGAGRAADEAEFAAEFEEEEWSES